ncbi:MAG: diguanylate cyclase [bacterium]
MKAIVYLNDKQLVTRVDGWLKQLSFQPVHPDSSTKFKKIIKDSESSLVVFGDKAINDPRGLLDWLAQHSSTTLPVRFSDSASPGKKLQWINAGGFACFSAKVTKKSFIRKIKPLATILKNREFLLDTHHSLGQKLRRESQSMAKKARYDGLTDLADKKYFENQATKIIQKCQEQGHSAALIVFDIDHFKNYNDTHGHPQGDEILKKLANITEQETRGDDLAGRIGGEEFSIILPRSDTITALRVANRLQKKLKKNSFKGEETQPEGRLTISQGIAEIPTHAKDFDRLYTLADRATYQAKRLGRNQIVKTALEEFSLDEGNNSKYSSVTVVGDFNSWQTPGESLNRVSPTRWEAQIPLPEGKQRYAFHLDNKKMIPDPTRGKKMKGPGGKIVTEIEIR